MESSEISAQRQAHAHIERRNAHAQTLGSNDRPAYTRNDRAPGTADPLTRPCAEAPPERSEVCCSVRLAGIGWSGRPHLLRAHCGRGTHGAAARAQTRATGPAVLDDRRPPRLVLDFLSHHARMLID
jgi:hypothetical protein